MLGYDSVKALIRADASIQIGMGHRVRCQALIHAFEALGWHCQFVVDCHCKLFATQEDCFIESEPEFWQLAEQADLVILDHYGYQADDIATLYQHQSNLLVLDDMNDRGDFPAKWVLNPLLEIYSKSIKIPLVGSQYALLRNAFTQLPIYSSSPDKLLITLGGTDPLALTLPIIKTLLSSGFPAKDMIVLLGSNASNAGRVICFCNENNIVVERGLSDVTKLMSQAKMAVSAAGGTLFELACMGVPTVFAQVADNQTRSLEQHIPLGWCRSVRFDTVAMEGRQALIEELIEQVNQQWSDLEWQQQARNVAQCLVDGKGAWRVAKAVDTYFN